MKRLLPILATLVLLPTAWGQAPIVPIEQFPSPTPAPSQGGGGLDLPSTPSDPVGPAPSVIPVQPTPVSPAPITPAPITPAPGNAAPVMPAPMTTAPSAIGPAAPSALPGVAVPNYSGGGCADPGCADPGCAGGCSAINSCGCIGSCTGACFGDGCLNPRRCPCPPNCGCPLCIPKRMWGGAAYVHGFIKSRNVPALVTTSPTGTARALAGVLPGADILYGGGSVPASGVPGLRADLGKWLGDGHVGIWGRFFYTESDGEGFEISSTGTDPIIGLPFFDIIGAQEDAILFSHPDVATDGTVAVSYDIETVSSEALLRFKILRSNGVHMDLVGGYHFLRVDDGLMVQGSTTDIDLSNAVPNGTLIEFTDVFGAQNTFHGGSIGLNLKLTQRRTTLRGLAKVSVGNMNQEVSASGSQTSTFGAAVNVLPFGIYAQQSVIGAVAQDRTAFIPEAQLQLGYRVSQRFEANIGYTMLYITNVATAGRSLDRNLDLTGATGAPLRISESSLFIQGITFGGAYNF